MKSLKMYRNIHLKLHILLTMIYVGFIFRYPNHVPMVDDWYLIPWTTPGASLNLNSMFSLLQGHQYFLGKLYAYSTGVLLGGNLFFASILMVILFSCGSYWIAKTIIDHSTFRQEDKIFIVIILTLLLFNVRQLQNFTSLICIGWTLSVLLLGISLKLIYSKKHKWILCASVFFSASCQAFGLALPLTIVTLYFLQKYAKKLRPLDEINLGFLSLISVAGIVFSYGTPYLFSNSSKLNDTFSIINNNASSSDNSGIISTFKFIFLAFANIFLPWSKQEWILNMGIFIGAVLTFIFVYLIIRSIKKPVIIKQIDLLILCFSLIFMLMFYFGRFHNSGIQIAIEARFTTGTVFVSLSAFIFFTKIFDLTKIIKLFGYVGIAAVTLNGFYAVFPYQKNKFIVSQNFNECILRENINTNSESSSDCRNIIDPGPWLSREDFNSSYTKFKDNYKVVNK